MKSLKIGMVLLVLIAAFVFAGLQLPAARIRHDTTRLWVYGKGIFHVAPVPPQFSVTKGTILSAELRDGVVGVVVTEGAQCDGRLVTASGFKLKILEVRLVRVSE